MKSISRLVLIGLLALIVLTSACNLPVQAAPTPVGTILSTAEIIGQPSPTNTPNSATPMPFIPVSGMDIVSLQCQFCVNGEAHAVLIMSNQAFFDVADPNTAVTCVSAQEVNEHRILLCRGAQQASFTLNVCMNDSDCLQFPILLQTCPLIPQSGVGTTATPFSPLLLTPIFAPSTPRSRDPTPVPDQTITVPAPTGEATPPTPEPTEVTVEPSPDPTVVPTEPPQPTEEITEPPPKFPSDDNNQPTETH